jgi:hypothetical protein
LAKYAFIQITFENGMERLQSFCKSVRVVTNGENYVLVKLHLQLFLTYHEAIQYRSLIVMVGWGKLDLTTKCKLFAEE